MSCFDRSGADSPVPRGGDLRPGTNGPAGSPKIYIRTITWRDKTSGPGTADNRVAFRISTHAMYSDKSAIDEMFREITKAASARQPAPPLEQNSQSSLSPLSPFCGSEKAMIASPTLPASGSTMLKLFRSGTLPPKA